MSLGKEHIKAAAVAMLDRLASEHPAGHQKSKAQRYLLLAPGGTTLEVMFERDDDSSANLWALAAALGPLASKGKAMPASALWTKLGADGKPLYGRHSGLKAMPQLFEADLVRLPLEDLATLGAAIDQLWAASAARIKV